MSSSQFMDKEILGLSRSSSHNGDFFDLLNPRQEDQQQQKKDDIWPSYDFHPIRSAEVGGPSSSLAAAMNLETTGGIIPGARIWNSADSKAKNASGFRNHGSPEKDRSTYDTVMVSEIDRTMKKLADNLLQALEGVSDRLSQLETRTRHLEISVDDFKVTVGNNHGSTDGRLRQLENILREVQMGVQVLHDKQEIADAQLRLAKLQVSKGERQPTENPNTQQAASSQQSVSQPQESIQSHLPLSPLLPPSQAPVLPLLAPIAPPPSMQQNPLPAQLQAQLPQNQMPSILPSLGNAYFPQSGQPAEAHHQQYQMPAQPLPPPQQYQAPPQIPQYSQPAPPPQQHQPPGLTFPPQLQPPSSHHPEESPHMPPPQTYPPNIHQQAHPPNIHQQALLTQPPSGPPTSQQIYGPPTSQQTYGPPTSQHTYRPTTHTYEPSGSRPSSGQPAFSAGYGPPSGPTFNDSYPYSSSPTHYSSLVKPPPHSPSTPAGGSSYPRLPTAQILPHALPTANSVSSSSSSGGTGNKVPIDDVVDKVVTMGFSRDQVRATVRKLTENGQSVDLNMVLDKLMNNGEIQPQKGWFGQ
ncbi:altered inheritance of mitochondria protein 3-like [Magnolia sinica]|uniref:altered inheritance of mitochondria protein 3-like n=1 Tax=Magnolia sinica TaxID=86752 RepID=UPI002659D4F9|nr:altered inheritance of mitochondria protein 3-like [Magnolia sinica]